METHPKIKIKRTGLDILLEVIIWATLIINWAMVLYFFPKLPESVPEHFNKYGEIDSYGSPGSLFLIPIISAITIAGLSVLNKFPYIFNYPVKITPENTERQYRNATRMIRVINLLIAIIFAWATFETIAVATDNNFVGIEWITLDITMLMIVVMIVYIVKAYKKK